VRKRLFDGSEAGCHRISECKGAAAMRLVVAPVAGVSVAVRQHNGRQKALANDDDRNRFSRARAKKQHGG